MCVGVLYPHAPRVAQDTRDVNSIRFRRYARCVAVMFRVCWYAQEGLCSFHMLLMLVAFGKIWMRTVYVTTASQLQ